jgi:hypothetical protein
MGDRTPEGEPLDPVIVAMIEAAQRCKRDGGNLRAQSRAAYDAAVNLVRIAGGGERASPDAPLDAERLREANAIAVLVDRKFVGDPTRLTRQKRAEIIRLIQFWAASAKHASERSFPTSRPDHFDINIQEPKEGTTMVDQPNSDNEANEPKPLWHAMEASVTDAGFNTARCVRLYREALSEMPMRTLLSDIHERVAVYYNLLEAVKGEPAEDVVTPGPTTAQRLKRQYEGLKLVPNGTLPNPWAYETAAYALKKLRDYGNMLVDLIAQYSDSILSEMKITSEITVTFEVEIRLPPGVTIGIERSGKPR